MSEFILKRKQADTIKVTIDDRSFQIPLGNSITPKDWAEINTFAGTVSFFRRYIPEEVADTLVVDDWNAITDAWKAATSEATGKTAGE